MIHDDGSIADAAATALVVAGADNWYQIARKMGIKYAMLVDDKGTIYMNPRMRDRVSFETPLPTDIRVSAPL